MPEPEKSEDRPPSRHELPAAADPIGGTAAAGRPTAVASMRRRPGRRRPGREGEILRGLVGRSPAFSRMLELVVRASRRSAPVLLLGESGTGKASVARAIHRLAHRVDRPFVAVHCAGLTHGLFERELFGRSRTAAGAAAGDGKIASARGGTLFLEDVGALGPAEQGELLRVVENARWGQGEPLAASFRWICAASPELRWRVAEGTFSADLYYRLSVFPIALPPLRQRLDDLPLLAECLLERLAGGRRIEIDPRTFVAFGRYRFPGNIRELRSILEYACLQADGGRVLPRHLPRRCREPAADCR